MRGDGGSAGAQVAFALCWYKSTNTDAEGMRFDSKFRGCITQEVAFDFFLFLTCIFSHFTRWRCMEDSTLWYRSCVISAC